jgi:epoxyqueuosine reductase
MKEALRRRALELGFDDLRVTTADPPESAAHFQKWLEQRRHGEMAYLERNAPKRVEPRQVLPAAKSIILLATSYSAADQLRLNYRNDKPSEPGSTSEPAYSGVVARYARYADYHHVLGSALKSLTQFVNEVGGPNTQSLWYVDTGPILERDLAQRAGLGFIGKHTNLISRNLGNWIFLSEIITTLDLEPDEPEKNRCGTCSRCLEACPTGAITAPFQLDARRCISYLTIELKGAIPVELRPAIGSRIYGCDDCLAVCPWNRFAREGRMMRDHAKPELDAPDLLELLSLDDAAFKRKFAGTPILRAKRRGLLRNVCVALGNIGDERVLPALEKAAADSEPLIAEHAQWALEQVRKRMHPELVTS